MGKCINKANITDNDNKIQMEETMDFIERYYKIDTQLARAINNYRGGFSYLINGMAEKGYDQDMVEVFKRVRECRNIIANCVNSSYGDLAQSDIKSDLDSVESWVNDNIGLVKELVAIGKNASERRK